MAGLVALVAGLIGLIRHYPLGGDITMICIGAAFTVVFGLLLLEMRRADRDRELRLNLELRRDGLQLSKQAGGTFVVSRVDPDSGKLHYPHYSSGVTEKQALDRARKRLEREA